MPTARERGRGRMPRILINGQAAAYSSFLRIRKSSLYHAGGLPSGSQPGSGTIGFGRGARPRLMPSAQSFSGSESWLAKPLRATSREQSFLRRECPESAEPMFEIIQRGRPRRSQRPALHSAMTKSDPTEFEAAIPPPASPTWPGNSRMDRHPPEARPLRSTPP